MKSTYKQNDYAAAILKENAKKNRRNSVLPCKYLCVKMFIHTIKQHCTAADSGRRGDISLWHRHVTISISILQTCWVAKAKSRKYREVFKVKSRVKTRQVREIWSQKFEHKQFPKTETVPGVRKGKRSLLACHTRCKCSMETTLNSVNVKLGIKRERKRSDSVLWQKLLHQQEKVKKQISNMTTHKRLQKLRLHNYCGLT